MHSSYFIPCAFHLELPSHALLSVTINYEATNEHKSMGFYWLKQSVASSEVGFTTLERNFTLPVNACVTLWLSRD